MKAGAMPQNSRVARCITLQRIRPQANGLTRLAGQPI